MKHLLNLCVPDAEYYNSPMLKLRYEHESVPKYYYMTHLPYVEAYQLTIDIRLSTSMVKGAMSYDMMMLSRESK